MIIETDNETMQLGHCTKLSAGERDGGVSNRFIIAGGVAGAVGDREGILDGGVAISGNSKSNETFISISSETSSLLSLKIMTSSLLG